MPCFPVQDLGIQVPARDLPRSLEARAGPLQDGTGPRRLRFLPKPRARSPPRSGTMHTVHDKALYSQPRVSWGIEVGMPGGGAGLLQLLLGLHGGVGWRLLERTPGPARSCALSPPSGGLALRPGTMGQRYPPTRGPPAPPGAPLQAAHPHCPGTWRSSPGPWSSCIQSPEEQESLDARPRPQALSQALPGALPPKAPPAGATPAKPPLRPSPSDQALQGST